MVLNIFLWHNHLLSHICIKAFCLFKVVKILLFYEIGCRCLRNANHWLVSHFFIIEKLFYTDDVILTCESYSGSFFNILIVWIYAKFLQMWLACLIFLHVFFSLILNNLNIFKIAFSYEVHSINFLPFFVNILPSYEMLHFFHYKNYFC